MGCFDGNTSRIIACRCSVHHDTAPGARTSGRFNACLQGHVEVRERPAPQFRHYPGGSIFDSRTSGGMLSVSEPHQGSHEFPQGTKYKTK